MAILDVGLEKPWAIMNLIAMNTMHANSFEEAQVSKVLTKSWIAVGTHYIAIDGIYLINIHIYYGLQRYVFAIALI